MKVIMNPIALFYKIYAAS